MTTRRGHDGWKAFTGSRGGGVEGDVEGSQIEPLELSWKNVMTVSLRAIATKRVESRHQTALSEKRATDGGIQQHLQNEILFPDDFVFYFSKSLA